MPRRIWLWLARWWPQVVTGLSVAITALVVSSLVGDRQRPGLLAKILHPQRRPSSDIESTDSEHDQVVHER